MSRGGRRPWKNTGGRDQQHDAVPDADVQWSTFLVPGEPKQIWPSSADGNWRDKVILSESLAGPEPEAEAEL